VCLYVCVKGAWLLWDNNEPDGPVDHDDQDRPAQVPERTAVSAWHWAHLLQCTWVQSRPWPSRCSDLMMCDTQIIPCYGFIRHLSYQYFYASAHPVHEAKSNMFLTFPSVSASVRVSGQLMCLHKCRHSWPACNRLQVICCRSMETFSADKRLLETFFVKSHCQVLHICCTINAEFWIALVTAYNIEVLQHIE